MAFEGDRMNVKKTAVGLLWACLAAAPAGAQMLDFNLDHLAARAKEHNVVSMDAAQLKALSALAAQSKPDKAAKVQRSLEGIEGLKVYTLEFDKDGQYGDADLEPIRKQLQAPGWSRIVGVKEKGESTEVHLMTKDGKLAGLAVIAAEPRELTVVHIMGSVRLDQLGSLVQSHITYDLSKVTAQSSGASAEPAR
jgi:hypothetical protein